jgi:histone-lysine N-methyltransferase SETMAR
MLQTVYVDKASGRSSVIEWFKRFKDGGEDLQDDPRRWRPSTSRNADPIANIREVTTRDRQWALRMMADEVDISKETIRQTRHEDLQKRRICTKFVPHRLTDEQKQQRVTSCQGFIQACQDNSNFLDCNVSGNESCVFQYDPETKRYSMQWTLKSSPMPKKFVAKVQDQIRADYIFYN